jgi:hypothetical protein
VAGIGRRHPTLMVLLMAVLGIAVALILAQSAGLIHLGILGPTG